MTELLAKAFQAAATLSDVDQDALAARILAAVEADRAWDDLFAATPDLLEQLAEEAHHEYLAGRTEILDPDTL